MCGFFGNIYNKKHFFNKKKFIKSAQFLEHRGPDDKSSFYIIRAAANVANLDLPPGTLPSIFFRLKIIVSVIV